MMRSVFIMNNLGVYSTHNKGKSVIAERLIRTVKNKIDKSMTSVSNKYIDNSDDIVTKYDNIYRKTIKIKPVDVKPNICIDFSKEINNEDPKFKIGDIVGISKHRNSLAKDCTPNWPGEFFAIKKLEILGGGHILH